MIRHFTFRVSSEILSPTPNSEGLCVCDITKDVVARLEESKIINGIAVIESLHTTIGLTVNENEPGLLIHDFPNMFQRIAPEAFYYKHDDFRSRTKNLDPNETERTNGHAHCRAILLPSSIVRTIENGALSLGRWQKILVIELDGRGRKNRKLKFMFMGET